MKKVLAVLLPLAMLISATSCSGKSSSSDSTTTAAVTQTETSSDVNSDDHGPKFQKYASMTPEEIVDTLTIEQKADQMVQPAIYNVTEEQMKNNDYGINHFIALANEDILRALCRFGIGNIVVVERV